MKRRSKNKKAQDSYNNAVTLSSGSRGSELYDWLVGGLSSAGYSVTEKTALSVAAVYACVNVIGGAIASMPFHIYKRGQDGNERIDSELWWLFNESPYPNWIAASFWEYIVQARSFHGDAFVRIHRASSLSPRVIGFEPVHPSRVSVVKENGLLLYTITLENGKITTVDQGDMLHIPGVGFDGIRSMSVLRHALRNSVGTALAADDYSSKFFSNSARPDFVLTVDGMVKPEVIDNIRDQWKARYTGTQNAHLPAILSGGMKAQQLTMNSEDAQLLDTRKFQVEDICRIFGVPPFMVGHNEKTTSWGSGVEQMSLGFVKYTLQRHLIPIQQEINRKIWPRSLRTFGEFNTAGLERGDLKTRYEAYRVGLGRAGEPAFLTVNEVRKKENLMPIDGGDILRTGNEQPFTQAADQQQG